ncbi:MAG TPA: hypothetical protein VJX10_10920 [Pseudonocardiaceae bacterium]|nr:hypothetical protein [Pseudonocardiaceae bacterium]
MSGFQTSDEMSGVAGRVHGEAGPIEDEAKHISTSHVTAADAGRDFADQGAAYLAALQHHVVASVRAFATATTGLGDRLTGAYQRYSQVDGLTTGTLGQAHE